MCLLVTAALGVAAAMIDTHRRPVVLALLSCLGVAVGLLLAAIHLGALRREPLLARGGLLAVALSQALYHVLVWSGLKTEALPWRLWWLAVVASLNLSHLVVLRAARRPPRDRLNAAATWSAVIAAVGWAGLVLRRDLFGELPGVLVVLGAIPIVITVIASLAIAVRAAALGERRWRLTPAWRRVGLALSYLVVLAVGLYVGRFSGERPRTTAAMPSALAHLGPAEVAAQLDADLGRLRTVVAGLAELEAEMAGQREQVRQQRAAEGRDYFLPHEDDQLRWSFVTFLSYRTALLRLVTTYAGFEAVADPALKARSFILGYAAGITVYRAGLDLVEAYGEEPEERRKLNEAEPSWGLPAGMFDRISASVSAERHAELCEEMAAYFEHSRQRWRDQEVWGEAEFDWLSGQIDASLETLRARRPDRTRRWVERFIDTVRADTYTPVYAVQSMVANLIGDIRVVDRPPLITPETIAAVKPRLRPGDILLERRSWYASNAFLPGFWPHAALYVGTIDDLRRLGVADAPEIANRLEAYLASSPDGYPYTVIEALAEGVIFATLEHSLHADYAAALRPRLDDDAIAEAIVTAFRHQGKPYDFEFDFFTADRLVCTELVYRSYRDALDLELTRVMGRDTLPAIEIVRKFARERGTPSQQLDLVLFLDGDPALGRAVEADEETFIASADRLREFNE